MFGEGTSARERRRHGPRGAVVPRNRAIVASAPARDALARRKRGCRVSFSVFTLWRASDDFRVKGAHAVRFLFQEQSIM